MAEKKKKRGFFDDFFGAGDDELFGDMFERMREDMDRMMRMSGEMRRMEVQKGNPRVYGFSMRIGQDGRPVVREFGNVKEPMKLSAREHGPEHPDEREPLVDVFREKKAVKVVAEMPGVSEKAIKVSIKGKELSIKAESGERKYSRIVELPEKVSTKKMKKGYRNGILELTFPL